MLVRSVTAIRRRTYCHADETRTLVLEQQGLVHAFDFIVAGERQMRVFLFYARSLGNTVNGARGGIDETLHTGFLGGDHQRQALPCLSPNG